MADVTYEVGEERGEKRVYVTRQGEPQSVHWKQRPESKTDPDDVARTTAVEESNLAPFPEVEVILSDGSTETYVRGKKI